jgi:integrase
MVLILLMKAMSDSQWIGSVKCFLTGRNCGTNSRRSASRALDDDELHVVWRAAQELPAPHGDVVRMLVLTGARLNEIGRMTWAEVDFDRKLWTLPAERAKNGRALALPLSDQALEILCRRSTTRDGDFVFAVNGAPVANWSRMKQRLDELAGLSTPFVLHDLRRSTVTGLARIGVDLPVIERIVNHASGSFRGIVSTYQKYSFEPEMRKALDHWGLYVENLPARTIITMPVEAADSRQLEAAA